MEKLNKIDWTVVVVSAIVTVVCIWLIVGCTFAPALHYGEKHYHHDEQTPDAGLVVEIVEQNDDEPMEED